MSASRILAPVTLLLLLVVSADFRSSAAAPSASRTPAMNADTLYARQDWPAAMRAYEAITMSDPTQPRAWDRLGV